MGCEIVRFEDGGVAVICGRPSRKQGPRCQHPGCNAPGTRLCDAPRDDRVTRSCDRRVCEQHSTRVGENTDHCWLHAGQLVLGL